MATIGEIVCKELAPFFREGENPVELSRDARKKGSGSELFTDLAEENGVRVEVEPRCPILSR